VIVHLVDGTYELFRCFYGIRRMEQPAERAVGSVLDTLLKMVETGATHIGVATDHVIESFRNSLWPAYKSGAGVDPALLAQFHPLEEALSAFGFAVWPMVELEADDALASGAAAAGAFPEVEQVRIWTPDKDLAQCVEGKRVVQVDRRTGQVRDAVAVESRFGVRPPSIPDYLALVGDSADGFPGVPGWGARSAATVLARYEHLENIPVREPGWRPEVANSARLSDSLRANWEQAQLFRDLATLRREPPVFSDLEELLWKGPRPDAAALVERLGLEAQLERARRAASG
jgi:5'-3' exonuclease